MTYLGSIMSNVFRILTDPINRRINSEIRTKTTGPVYMQGPNPTE
jgi:hypothetical protein